MATSRKIGMLRRPGKQYLSSDPMVSELLPGANQYVEPAGFYTGIEGPEKQLNLDLFFRQVLTTAVDKIEKTFESRQRGGRRRKSKKLTRRKNKVNVSKKYKTVRRI
jgi:hypothetical protein